MKKLRKRTTSSNGSLIMYGGWECSGCDCIYYVCNIKPTSTGSFNKSNMLQNT